MEQERVRLDALLRSRKRDGFIRECHGDLHLGNLTLIDGRVTLFDCIEFNPELRWIDVISEVAFLIMDLQERGYAGFANRFLNGYLQHTGDYEGIGVLPYYLVYRAAVRAKVAVLRAQQAAPASPVLRHARREYHEYASLAGQYTEPRRPALLITCGLSGSGKSTLAGRLCEQLGLIQLRSDLERKRLAGLAAQDNSRSALGAGLYTPDQTEQTYRRLAQLAAAVIGAGYTALVDATFLQRRHREMFRGLAGDRGVPFAILDCQAPEAELRRRIRQRQAAGADASEANLQVLDAQLAGREAQHPLHQVDAGIEYHKDNLSLAVAWYGSFFTNNNPSLTWETPYLATPETSLLRMAREPDNEFQQVSLSGKYRLDTWKTVIAFLAASGTGKQNEAFLDYTSNSNYEGQFDLPRDTLDGKVDTLNYSFTLTSRPNDRLRVKFGYRYDERDNRTPVAEWSRVIVDGFPSGDPGENVPYSYDRMHTTTSVEYRVLDNLRFSGGYEYREINRDFQEVAEQTTNTGWGQVRWQPAAWPSI